MEKKELLQSNGSFFADPIFEKYVLGLLYRGFWEQQKGKHTGSTADAPIHTPGSCRQNEWNDPVRIQ